ncbi:MAG: hypothetical protein ACTSX1_09070 [Candidatus Heimdallarchaeaceae archaeon]
MNTVDDVFKQLNEEFGLELFNICEKADDMTEKEATEVMEDFTKRAGKKMKEIGEDYE